MRALRLGAWCAAPLLALATSADAQECSLAISNDTGRSVSVTVLGSDGFQLSSLADPLLLDRNELTPPQVIEVGVPNCQREFVFRVEPPQGCEPYDLVALPERVIGGLPLFVIGPDPAAHLRSASCW